MIVYHIALPEVWEFYKTKPSYQPESLAVEGFIHCSYEHQLEAVLDRYFSGIESVVIVKIETEKLIAKLVEEPSTGGEIYPHIYGRLNHNAVVAADGRDLAAKV